jgi:hypothetical protein
MVTNKCLGIRTQPCVRLRHSIFSCKSFRLDYYLLLCYQHTMQPVTSHCSVL